MDNNKQKMRLKRLTMMIIVVIGLFVIIDFIRLQKFHVVSTNPDISQVSSIAPFFKINFNKQILKSSVNVSSVPKIIASYSVQGKTLDITLLSMNISTPYTITINSVSAEGGAIIKNMPFHFVAKDISADELPKDQQQAILKNQEFYPKTTINPIIKYLPHETLNYTLSAHFIQGTNNQPQLILQAEIQLNQADMSDEATAIANYKQQVVNYIQSLGLNPDNYTIDYTVSSL